LESSGKFQKFKPVLEWSSKKRAEDNPNANFYWTKVAKQLLFKLENEDSLYVGLVGLSGIGKSHTIYALEKAVKLNKTNYYLVRFKWENRPLWDLLQRPELDDLYKEGVFEAYFNTERGEKHLKEHHGMRGNIERFSEFTQIENKVPAKIRQEIKEKITFDILSSATIIFIDFPDYGRSDVRLLNRDLTQIGNLWSRLRADNSDCNIVVSIQKELLDKSGGHYTVRKMDILTIEPLKPEELVAFYKEQFRNAEPFTEDALLLIANLSRGIYRRFKKYIQTCIEVIAEERLITIEDVKVAITEDELAKDMELELSNIFPQTSQCTQAVRVINYVRAQGECNQKDVAEYLNVSEATAGKLVNKLVEYKYLHRKRGEGNTWIIMVVKS